jgi:hypothetical protein
MVNQYIFEDENEYFLVEVYDNKVTLSIKRNGWSDTWSAPIKETRR